MTKLELAIAYDIEHDLFHPQNVFSDEYITPTFVKYVAELEKEIKNLKLLHSYDVIVLKAKNNKAKEIIKGILPYITFTFDEETDSYLRKYYKQAENFIED